MTKTISYPDNGEGIIIDDPMNPVIITVYNQYGVVIFQHIDDDPGARQSSVFECWDKFHRALAKAAEMERGLGQDIDKQICRITIE